MENHPIPQDITGFQFKLIGDMTIKQFAYLASGFVLAWITFSLPVSAFLKLPLSSALILFGISFAFLSLGGRPIDVMILNFMRATLSSTKYVYQSPRFDFSFKTAPQKQIEEININPSQAGSIPLEKQNPLDKKEFDFFHMLSQMLNPTHPQSAPVQHQTKNSAPYIVTARVEGEKKAQTPPQRSEREEKENVEKLEEQSEELSQQLKAAVQIEEQSKGSPTYEDAHKKVLEIEKTLSETLVSKQNLESEIVELKKQLEMQKKEVFTPSQTVPSQTPNVRTITSAEQGKSAGLPTLSEFPNIVTGIIKDPRGNPMQNILVEVKDNLGNPVRAFKTNPLGQFQASTPLSNGVYTIEFDDPKGMSKFDIVKFEANGNIILPLEVISIDTREELRKSLFTN